MTEMPTGVALLAIAAGLFFMFILIWGSAANLSFWPRLLVRLFAAAALIIFPMAYVAANQIEVTGGPVSTGPIPSAASAPGAS